MGKKEMRKGEEALSAGACGFGNNQKDTWREEGTGE